MDWPHAEQPEKYHTYEAHRVPWWLALKWLAYGTFALVYMVYWLTR